MLQRNSHFRKRPLSADSVDEVAASRGPLGAPMLRALCLPSWSERFRDRLGEFPEVLRGICELELFGCAFGSSQSHHVQADVSFETCEQHFDLTSLDKQGHVGVRFADIPGDVPGCFMN